MLRVKKVWLGVLCIVSVLIFARAWGTSNKVKLKEVDVITLHQGEMTTGRRSSPVPQLRCVGGSAYGMFKPQIVQCYNRGSDGRDVQWECKADMDTSYRFGRIQVSCEGYDYPDDDYILKGSCGLEYDLELTEEGRAKKGYNSGFSATKLKTHSSFGNVFFLLIVAAIIYFIYTRCIKGMQHTTRPSPSAQPSGPPPPGFRPEFMPGNDHSTRYGGKQHDTAQPASDYPDEPPPPYPGTQQQHYSQSGTFSNTAGSSGSRSSSGGGFWTGAGIGGVLGYLAGSSGTRHRHNYHHGGHGSWGQSSGWSQSGWSGNRSGGSSSSHSSSTRTASGFGGTTRR